MIYRLSWIKTTPSNRKAGLNHLQSLAKIIKQDDELDSSVFISDTVGPFYLIGLVIAYKSIAALYEDHEVLNQIEDEHNPLFSSTNLFDSSSPQWTTLRELKAGATEFPNFLNIVSIQIRPGQIEEGREQMIQLATQYESNYGRPMGVMSNETGEYHQHHWTIAYDDLDQYEADFQKNATWGQLTQSLDSLFDLATMKRNVGRFL
ncbi:MAG: hypothetical protein AB8G95_19225 [Anaerolineae bacterium]